MSLNGLQQQPVGDSRIQILALGSGFIPLISQYSPIDLRDEVLDLRAVTKQHFARLIAHY